MTIKTFFKGFASVGFWFSRDSIIHSLTHIAVGALISQAICLLVWLFTGYVYVWETFILSLFMVGQLAFIIEYIQYWVFKKDEYYENGYIYGWTDYAPQDQTIDVLTYLAGCGSVLFWLI